MILTFKRLLILATAPFAIAGPIESGIQLIPEFEDETIFDNTNQQDLPDHGNLRRVQAYPKGYLYFVEETSGLCVTVKDKKIRNGSNIWFKKCKKQNPYQLWRFSTEDGYYSGGTLHTKANESKCVQARPNHPYGSRLRMNDCDETLASQIFRSDGDGITHLASGLTAFSRRELRYPGAKDGNYLVLVDEAWSLDQFFDDEYI